MSDREYLEIIIRGWREDSGGNLKNHFYREWKKAESNHYTLTEFFASLIRVQKSLTADIDRQKGQRRHEISLIRNIWENEGKDTKELEGQENALEFSINLLHLTGDLNHAGLILWQADINYIGGQIAFAFERITKESGIYRYSDFNELFDDVIAFKDLPTPINALQKSNQQSLHKYQFDSFLHKMKNVDENSYTDYLTRNSFKEYLEHINEIQSRESYKENGINKSEKPTVKSYAILHALWKKHDVTKAITDTNKAIWATKYRISQNTLKREFDNYFEKANRKPVSRDKRAVEPFIKSFSFAVNMIKTLCPQAFEEANNELSALRKNYQADTN